MSNSERAEVGEPLLSVSGLTVTLNAKHKPPVTLLDGVDLTVGRGERLALVGESGSGKSLTATAIMGLLDPPLSSTFSRMSLGDVDLGSLGAGQWRDVRGGSVGLVQQDPLTALSPVFDVGTQIAETLRRHRGLDRVAARARAVECLREVGVPDAERRAGQFPHQLSGGLRQRAAIAVAVACTPSLLLADEPTTALDVTVQAQVMRLLKSLSEEKGMGLIFITHDLGILGDFADRIAVMYSGRIVEIGTCREVLGSPQHPYTRALINAQPGLHGLDAGNRRRLPVIAGSPPNPTERPTGCSFAPRCRWRTPQCEEAVPLLAHGTGSSVACHRVGSISEDPA